MADGTWDMKVLAGVHAGAEVTLAAEDAVVGTDDDCDFVFDDPGLAGRHFVLLPGEDSVRLTLLDHAGTIVVDGQPVDSSVEVAPYSVVACGRLALAFGPTGQPWPPMEVPEVAVDEAVEDPAGEANDVEPADAPDETAAPVAESDAPVPVRRRWVAVGGIAVAAAVLVAVTVWLLVPRQVERQATDPKVATAAIEKLATERGAAVRLHVDDDGIVRVEGHVATNAARTELLQELANAHHRAVVHITSTEEIAGYARAVLGQALGLDARDAVEVAPVEDAPGTLHISGYVVDEARLAHARRLLERDVKEATGFTYAVETRDTRLAVLRTRLDALGFGRRLRIQRFPDRVGLFGAIASAEELARVEELAASFNKEYASRPRLEVQGTDSLLGESTIALEIRAVVGGDDLHVILHDGTRVVPGSEVDGYQVETITERYMILERAAQGLQDAARADDVAYFVFADA